VKPPPSTHADLSQWIVWVDEHYPYQSRTYDGPSELATLVRYEDRGIAASAARVWFAMQEKRQPPSGVSPAIPVQADLDLGSEWHP
jgi:hypothetical protein